MQQSQSLIDGKYQLVRCLGEGGMGAVYEGRHLGTGRRIAVKLVSPTVLVKGPDIVERFRREAMASGAIESQYIAHVLDTGVDSKTGSPYIVMELLVGEDLQQTLRRVRRFTPDIALRIAAHACMGLQKAHDAGVIHRDVKPANLYLTRRDHEIVVKLLDFGVAKVRLDPLTNVDADKTRSGMMLGSPAYMSPEQARGKKTIDQRSDIFSLGVVLYEMLAGKTPHSKSDTIGDLIVRICGEPARPLQEVAPSVNAATAAIVHKALALDPTARFGSASEMLAAIRALIPGGFALDETILPLADTSVLGAARSAPGAEPVRKPAASVPAFTPSPAMAPVEPVPNSFESGSTIAHTPTSKSEPRGQAKSEISTGSGKRAVQTGKTPASARTPAAPPAKSQGREPMQKRIFVPAARKAAVMLWGEDGLNDIAAAVDDDTREEFFRTVSSAEPIACKHIENWCLTAWKGPAKMNKPKMTEYVDRIFDLSYGVVRRGVLRLADPAALIPRLPAFWKEDYTTGELTAVLEPDGKSATIHIIDHPFADTPHARAAMAESYRYAFSMTRAKEVKESHGLVKPGVMMFKLRWT
ncbi:MAG: protein kinase domain-containing protein [Polyangiaceae bacterium]